MTLQAFLKNPVYTFQFRKQFCEFKAMKFGVFVATEAGVKLPESLGEQALPWVGELCLWVGELCP